VKIVFQNERWVLVDKVAGMLSVPSSQGTAETRMIVGIELQKQLGKRIFPVHRLDVEVSGLLLFSLNSDAHKEASRVFESHLVQKTYEAWSQTDDTYQVGFSADWASNVLKGKKRAFESEHGKASLTTAKVLRKLTWNGTEVLVWNLSPHTGRSHQLRFEMYKHKVPIIGDALYSSTIAFRKNEIALRAVELNFSKAQKVGLMLDLPSPIIKIDPIQS
jgi:tRNA pseudouridine32 synthase / 23S rRNA pseudouridine746 synthase